MPSILVVEQEPRYVERINSALRAEGWSVRVVSEADQALLWAASEAPDLVLVNAGTPGAESLWGSFSRSAGGPGVLGLVSEGQARPGGADDVLAKPFSDQDLVLAARRALLSRRQPPAGPAVPAQEQKLTSADIFGDVLAEVEGDGGGLSGPALAPPPRPPLMPVAAAPPKAPAPAPPGPQSDDVNRKLEQTLSGLGVESRPRPAAPAAPPPRRAETSTGADVDAMLSKTLSNLELGRTKSGVIRPAAPAPAPPVIAPPVVAPPAPPAPVAAPPAPPQEVRPAPVPVVPAPIPAPAPAPPPAAPPAAVAAPPQEGTAVRKPRTVVGDFDFSELEELARSSRRPEPPAAAPAPPRPAPAPPMAPAAVPQVREAAPPRPVEPPRPAAPPLAAPPAPVEAPPFLSARPAPAAPSAPAAPPVRPPQDFAATQRIPVMLGDESDQPGERFGQYTLLEKIAVGGMAEVWKARMRGVEGFQKTVAIKKILPHMTDNSEFVGMFIDEAKLAAQLSHPNIVHIYDLGKLGRDFYIAMEYVEGK
ncbi:MAG TPA: protein kinase, partial [Thermoanaerobaculia bacterium]|nr:protein kinase [Thermoanaerobaculia bacterium]